MLIDSLYSIVFWKELFVLAMELARCFSQNNKSILNLKNSDPK